MPGAQPINPRIRPCGRRTREKADPAMQNQVRGNSDRMTIDGPPLPGQSRQASGTNNPRRAIRSFMRREGRITAAQRRAFERHWQRFGIDYVGMPQDFDSRFGRHAPRVLEIGFGNGEALAWASEHEPGRDFIGIEVHRPGAGRLMNALAESDARNVRIYCHDAVEVLQHEIPENALDEVRIWFPDPWPKKRHHKRRLVQPAFAALLAGRVVRGGRLHLATDWPDYVDHMQDVLAAQPAWRERTGTDDGRPAWRITTRFERRGIALGHPVRDLLYDRV
jgi:tRNA (guanine-N7-)-methyltransferase